MSIRSVWPSEPSAEAVRRTGVGSCASKHALLREELAALGVESRPMFVVGPLVPEMLHADPVIGLGAGLVEVHEFLSVSVPGVGPCRVDVTWDPALVRAGLSGQTDWDGSSDMALAVGEASAFWAPDPGRLREEKELLRSRLYSGADRARRDTTLAAMSERFAQWRRIEDDRSRLPATP